MKSTANKTKFLAFFGFLQENGSTILDTEEAFHGKKQSKEIAPGKQEARDAQRA